MANYELHYILNAGELFSKIQEAGLIEHVRFNENTERDNVLVYSKCCKEEWEKEKVDVLDNLSKDPNLNLEGDIDEVLKSYGFGYCPIQYNEEKDSILWSNKWMPNFNPNFYISKAFPDEILQVCSYYEGRQDATFFMKDGEITNAKGDPALKIINKVKISNKKDVDEHTCMVVLPLLEDKSKTSKDTQFVKIYVPKENVIMNCFDENSDKCIVMLTSEKQKVYFPDKTSKYLSVDEIAIGVNHSRNVYLYDMVGYTDVSEDSQVKEEQSSSEQVDEIEEEMEM